MVWSYELHEAKHFSLSVSLEAKARLTEIIRKPKNIVSVGKNEPSSGLSALEVEDFVQHDGFKGTPVAKKHS